MPPSTPGSATRAWPATPALGWPVGRSLRAAGRFVRSQPLGALGAGIILALLVMAAFAERVAPYGYD